MLTESQYENLQCLIPNRKHTLWVRSQYQGAEDERLTIAWHTLKRRWVICRVLNESILRGEEFKDVTVLKPLSMWQGPGDIYLPIDGRIVAYLRAHDTYNAKDYGTWHDSMFQEPDDSSHWDRVTEALKEHYERNKSQIQSVTSPARENGKRKHFYDGCLTTPDRGKVAA